MKTAALLLSVRPKALRENRHSSLSLVPQLCHRSSNAVGAEWQRPPTAAGVQCHRCGSAVPPQRECSATAVAMQRNGKFAHAEGEQKVVPLQSGRGVFEERTK